MVNLLSASPEESLVIADERQSKTEAPTNQCSGLEGGPPHALVSLLQRRTGKDCMKYVGLASLKHIQVASVALKEVVGEISSLLFRLGVPLIAGGITPSSHIVAGHQCTDRSTNKCFVFDASAMWWKALPSLLRPGTPICVSLADGEVLVIHDDIDDIEAVGGCAVEAFPSSGAREQAWQRWPSLPLGDSFGVVAVPDGTLMLLGGRRGAMCKSSSQIRMVNPRTGHEKYLGMMTKPSFSFALASLPDGRIITAGGDWPPTRQAMLYNPIDGRSTKIPDMHECRIGCSGVVLPDGRFAVLGGEDFWSMGCISGFDVFRSCEVFDPLQWRWDWLPSMQEARTDFAAWVIGDHLIVSGGRSTPSSVSRGQEAILSSTEMLDLSSPQSSWELIPWLQLPLCLHSMGSTLCSPI